MTPKDKKNNNNKPANKADVVKVADDVDNLAIATKNALDRIETKMATKESQERILSIVESIDQHFKEHKDIPRRVDELGADIFKLKTQQR